MLLATSTDATLGHARATSWLGVWVGWGGAITFMLLAISSDATLGLRHGLGIGRGGVRQ